MDYQLDVNTTTGHIPGKNETCPYTSSKDCWPTWMNIGIPLLCVVFFIIVLLVIVLFPNRPPHGGKEMDFMKSLSKCGDPLELNSVQRVKSAKKSKLDYQDEIKSAMV